MKKLLYLGLMGVLVLVGCSGEYNSAKISEIKICTQIDPTYKSPIDPSDKFSPDTPKIFCTAKLSNAPEGTSVLAEFYYLEQGEAKVAEKKLTDLSGTRYVSFVLAPSAAGWPRGKYKAVLSLNDKIVGETGFYVGESPAKTVAPVAAVRETEKPSVTPPTPTRTAKTSYRTFSDAQQGYSLKYPSNWYEGEKKMESVSFIYLANRENNPVANINVQVIPVTIQNPSQEKDAVDLAAQQFIDQIMEDSQAQIVNDQWVDVQLNHGREIVFSYPYKNKNLMQRQFLVFHDSKVFAVIYTAEDQVYEQYLNDYETAIETLTFFKR